MPIERIKELSRNNRLISALRTKRKVLHDAFFLKKETCRTQPWM